MVMPWKMVTRNGTNLTLTKAVDSIFSHQESEGKERKRRNREKEEVEKQHKKYYEAHMKEETKRLNKLVDWCKFKLVDSRTRKLEKLYQSSEKNKHLGVTITRAETINPVNYPGYPPELELHEYEDNEKDVFCNIPAASSLPAECKPSNQLDYLKKIIRAYQGRDEDTVKYVKKVEELIDQPLDELELGNVRLAMAKVKCPCKLDILVFYQLTRRLLHKDGVALGCNPRPAMRAHLNCDDERLLIHFYDIFYNESIKLLGTTVRRRVNVLYHLLAKIGKEPNADLFEFMKGPSHQ